MPLPLLGSYLVAAKRGKPAPRTVRSISALKRSLECFTQPAPPVAQVMPISSKSPFSVTHAYTVSPRIAAAQNLSTVNREQEADREQARVIW